MFALKAVFARLPLAKVSFATRIGNDLAVGLVITASFLTRGNHNGADLPFDIVVLVRQGILMVDTCRRIVLLAWFNDDLLLHDIANDAGSQSNREDSDEDTKVEPR